MKKGLNIKSCSNEEFIPLDTYNSKPLFFTLGLSFSGIRISMLPEKLYGRCKRCKANHIFTVNELQSGKFYIDDKFEGILFHPPTGFPAYKGYGGEDNL